MNAQQQIPPSFNIILKKSPHAQKVTDPAKCGLFDLSRSFLHPALKCFIGFDLQMIEPLTRLSSLTKPLPTPINQLDWELERMRSIGNLLGISSNDPTTDYLLKQEWESDRNTQRASETVNWSELSLDLAKSTRRELFTERLHLRRSNGKDLVTVAPETTGFRVKSARSVRCEPICRLISSEEDGERLLNQNQYRSVFSSRQSFHLFIDMTSPTKNGQCKAGRIWANGIFEETDLSYREASVLVEYIRRRSTLHPNNLKSLRDSKRVDHPEKIVELSRRKVDVFYSRCNWRAFKTIRGGTRKEKRYRFDPPDNFHYAVILPLDFK